MPYAIYSVDYFYLIKHGTILCGKNIVKDLNKINSISRLNIALYVAGIKCLLNGRWERISACMDMSYGMLPAIRLILENKIITTTPKEVFEEYYKSYAHEEEIGALIQYYERQKIRFNNIPRNNRDDIRKAYIFGKHCLRAIDAKIKEKNQS
jgi:hypothetical protein